MHLQDSTFAYDEFVSAQSRYIKKQAEGLVIRCGQLGAGFLAVAF